MCKRYNYANAKIMYPTTIYSLPARKIYQTRRIIEKLPPYMVKEECGMTVADVKQLLPVFNYPSSDRSYAIPPETRALVFLSYLRGGAFQWNVSSSAGISRASTSRIIDESIQGILSHVGSFIYFPQTDEELSSIKQKFYEIGRFPNVIGAVDGTHVNIQSPPKDIEAVFVNRKHHHSINVQVISDPNHCFLDVVAKFPGSAHDSFIWKNSGVRQRIARGDFGSGWLLGIEI